MPIDEYHARKMLGNPWIHKVDPICPNCGYNLTGVHNNTCPECGVPLRWKVIEQQAREFAHQRIQLADVNLPPRFGLIAACAGLALLGVAKLLGDPAIAQVIGVFTALIAFCLGLSVFRVKRLPKWMINELKPQPNFALGVSAAGLAILLALLCFLL